MPTLDALKADILRHLNDRDGRMFTDEPEIISALEGALREIALIRDPKNHQEVFPREFMAFMSKETPELPIVESYITMPESSLRILGGKIGSSEIATVKGIDYEWKKNDTMSEANVGAPWLVARNGKFQVWPVGQWKPEIKAVIRYVSEPPPYLDAHPAIVMAMTLTAARNMAFDREFAVLGNLLASRAQQALTMAIGIPFATQEKKS